MNEKNPSNPPPPSRETYIDITLLDGPKQKKNLKDQKCLYIYVIFLLGMIGLSLYAVIQGNPYKLGAPVDPDGHICGYSSLANYYPYLYFATPNVSVNATKNYVCARSCPSASDLLNPNYTFACYPNSRVPDCNAVQLYATELSLDVLCQPLSETFYAEVQPALQSFDFIMATFKDISSTWFITLAVFFITLFLCLIFIILIRKYQSMFFLTAILLNFFFLFGIGLFCSLNSLKNDPFHMNIITIGVGIFFFICCLISGILSIFVQGQFIRTVNLIAIGESLMQENREIVFIPFLCFGIMVMFISQWAIIALFLFSIKTPDENPDDLSPFSYEVGGFQIFSLIYMLIAVYWNCHFIGSFCQVFLSHIACMWYSASKKPNYVLDKPIMTSFRRTLKKHMGSLALGSLLIGFINAIRLFLKSIHYFVENFLNNSFGQGCCCCCLAIYDGIQIFSREIWISMSLTGKSFKSSAQFSYDVNIKQNGVYSKNAFFSRVMMFLVNIFLASFATGIGLIITFSSQQMWNDLNSVAVPAIVYFAVSAITSSLFTLTYSTLSNCLLFFIFVEKEVKGKAEKLSPVLNSFYSQYIAKKNTGEYESIVNSVE